MTNTTRPPVVEFYYDIVCPFAYIASTRIEAVARRSSATVVWRPVLLGGIYRATEAPQGAQGSATDPMNPTKRAVFQRSFRRTLKRLQVPIHMPAEHPRKTVDALRLLHCLPDDARAAVSHALFKAYWVDNVDVSRRDVVLQLARRALQGGTSQVQALLKPELFDDAGARKSLEQATADAVARGAPGVPGFWHVGPGPTKGRLYWGQDRLPLLEARLGGVNKASPAGQAGPGFRGLIPRCRELKPVQHPAKLEFWFDFSSPWAYLGWTRLDSLRRTFGSQLEIDLKPILLGALFKEIGAPMMPSTVVSEQKRQYGLRDLFDWVKFWGAVDEQEGRGERQAQFRWPDNFPIRSPTLLRCAIVNLDCIPVLYEAAWAKNLNISSEDVLRDVLSQAGFDAEKLLAQARSRETKDILTANTKAAKEAGFCGVPTFRVFRRDATEVWKQAGDLVWGQDELAVVEDLIGGWDESSHEVAEIQGEMSASPRYRI
ncbi:protein disulfide [Xylariaceae sp. FL0016]|nr:protein disulfide [Xylariaceae sp. FL0016]